jgi:hypothetical protein
MLRKERSVIEEKDPHCCGNPVITTSESRDHRDAGDSENDAGKNEQRDLLAEALEKWKIFQNERSRPSESDDKGIDSEPRH